MERAQGQARRRDFEHTEAQVTEIPALTRKPLEMTNTLADESLQKEAGDYAETRGHIKGTTRAAARLGYIAGFKAAALRSAEEVGRDNERLRFALQLLCAWVDVGWWNGGISIEWLRGAFINPMPVARAALAPKETR